LDWDAWAGAARAELLPAPKRLGARLPQGGAPGPGANVLT